MPRGVKFVAADLDSIFRAYEEGQTASQIAQRYGTSRDTIYRLLRASGVPVREGGRPRKQVDPEEVARLYLAGLSVTEIAQIFGCYRSIIDHRLMRAGRKPKPGAVAAAPARAKAARLLG